MWAKVGSLEEPCRVGEETRASLAEMAAIADGEDGALDRARASRGGRAASRTDRHP